MAGSPVAFFLVMGNLLLLPALEQMGIDCGALQDNGQLTSSLELKGHKDRTGHR